MVLITAHLCWNCSWCVPRARVQLALTSSRIWRGPFPNVRLSLSSQRCDSEYYCFSKTMTDDSLNHRKLCLYAARPGLTPRRLVMIQILLQGLKVSRIEPCPAPTALTLDGPALLFALLRPGACDPAIVRLYLPRRYARSLTLASSLLRRGWHLSGSYCG